MLYIAPVVYAYQYSQSLAKLTATTKEAASRIDALLAKMDAQAAPTRAGTFAFKSEFRKVNQGTSICQLGDSLHTVSHATQQADQNGPRQIEVIQRVHKSKIIGQFNDNMRRQRRFIRQLDKNERGQNEPVVQLAHKTRQRRA
jgi:hypothetical protein